MGTLTDIPFKHTTNRKLSKREINRLIKKVSKKQEKILTRKYITEEELRKSVVTL
jgi:hypothetical protein